MNRRILLVDDNAAFLREVRELLGKHFEVVTAGNGLEALTALEREGPFAVVVSDHQMPGMSGVELLGELAEKWPDTARILMTASKEMGLALEALERGSIFRFLSKPPDAARLQEAVKAGADRYNTIEEERVFTEQLSFARESLQTLNGVLEQRLERELDQLDQLARGSERIAQAESTQEILERTTEAVRDLFGARAPTVRHEADGFHIELKPDSTLRARERRTLAILSHSASGALARAERQERALEAQRTTLLALQQMARQRDDETGEHLTRVSLYVRLLAEGLREAGHYRAELSNPYIEALALAAPLHDIGKVAIPDAILFKPGKLDDREWEVMRTHSAVGAEILRGVQAGREDSELLELAREVAWTHHERWDGTGYPRQLAREAIPLCGRIMAMADCYDALTSERPYKHAWSHHEAATHLLEQRGLAFEPALVDVFLVRQGEFAARLEQADHAGA